MRAKVFLAAVVTVFSMSLAAGGGEAAAACRDDCHASCCGSDPLCRGAEQVKCLAACLKDCKGDSVPPVPAPVPAAPEKKQDKRKPT